MVLVNLVIDCLFCPDQDRNKGPAKFSILTILMRPKSRGSLRLRGRDPNLPPIIDLNYFDHPDDIEILAKGRAFLTPTLP